MTSEQLEAWVLASGLTPRQQQALGVAPEEPSARNASALPPTLPSQNWEHVEMLAPDFSEHSYAFRPGRGAHDAIAAAQRYIEGGRTWVVDLDLERFFDRVNHDVLTGRLAKRIDDRLVLGLVRAYLRAGILANGVVTERHEGTSQGGPLSPLLANALLDEVDKELEKRGHAFARYADDSNVYVRSKRASERLLLLGSQGRRNALPTRYFDELGVPRLYP
jgi:hypothetical protein